MLFKKNICPYCYEQFSSKNVLFRCENPKDDKCPLENDIKLAEYFDQSAYLAKKITVPKITQKDGLWSKIMSMLINTKVEYRCDACKYNTHTVICPHCHNHLPPTFNEADCHIISVIGARNSGKTHYITVLINELEKKGYKLSIDLLPQNHGIVKAQRTSKRYNRNYKTPLINEGTELPQTQQNERDYYPLIYRIDSRDKNAKGKSALFLVFYDTAGENFQDNQDLTRMANYIANSSGIIFLLDSFQIPRIKRELYNRNIVTPKITNSYSEILDEILNLYEKQRIKKNIKTQAKIPVAITFSKFDELIKHALFNESLISPALLYQDSHYLGTGKYSSAEIEDISLIIKSNLLDWEENGFVSKAESNFRNVRFFGVSALGATPNQGKLEGGIVRPHRVMDPLIWILDQLKFSLPKVSEK